MDYEEISTVPRFAMPSLSTGTYIDRHYESVRGDDDMNMCRNGGRNPPVVSAGGLSPTVRDDRHIYSKVIRRCSPASMMSY